MCSWEGSRRRKDSDQGCVQTAGERGKDFAESKNKILTKEGARRDANCLTPGLPPPPPPGTCLRLG